MDARARPLRAEIDLDALRYNYRLAKSLAPGARALAVVKANGYGHGAVECARALAGLADGFALACAGEALELRESGIAGRMLLLEGVFAPSELELADRARLDIVVHSPEQLDWVLDACPRQPLNCWIKLDSGMHRVGFSAERFAAAHARLAACSHVGELVAMTHFARADEPDCAATERQRQHFEYARTGLSLPGSLANSAAILAWPHTHAEWVRPGIMLYGASPFGCDESAARALRPVMTLRSELIAVRELAAGEPVGYGGRFVAERALRVGVVAAGYADGYPRHASDGTPVAVNGRRTRLVGRVSMDMLTVDLTGQPQARVGDPVELWGELIRAGEVAAASQTIAYQLFTGLGRRVACRYHGAL